MAHSIVMPALEMAQETGKLISWRKKEGDTVAKGELLLDVETDKAVVEIESPADGILAAVKAREGDVIPVGQTIAWIVSPGENPPVESGSTAAVTGRKMDAQASPPSGVSSPSSASPPTPATPNARVSPKARRLAREHNIDLGRVHGTGSEGEILAEDVLALVNAGGLPSSAIGRSNATAAQSTSGAIESMSTTARLMAERTTQSWTSVPHFFVVRELDATALLAVREKLAAAADKAQTARVTHTDILVTLVARILMKHPRVNAAWTGEGIHLNPDVNIGIAMAVDDGVVAAVIPGAHTKNIGEVTALRSALTERARSGKLRPADITGATFTISNLGMYNVDAFTAIIPTPQAAILAVGRIADRVVPVDGQPAIRPMVTFTLSSDHRVIDGARAALFLNDLAAAILEPEKCL
jgi:pyruvate dehydrogenase E2 component (dihydrolipoamide acetyltransferase)